MKYVFPDPDQPLNPSWRAPLEAIARAVAGKWKYQFFDLGDFMIMLRVVRPPRPSLVLYKHRYTRRYLNLDDAAHAYRYIESKDPSGSGRYLAHRDLTDALDHLGLWELPWMKPGLEPFRYGHTWRERFLVRDVLDPIDEDERPAGRAKGRGRARLRVV
jgi:hypothetical protein